MNVAVLLAAGASRRLGAPKQLLDYGGAPLVCRVLDTLLQGGFDATCVVLGAGAADVAAALVPRVYTALHNPVWQEGIASSIRVATAWARARAATSLFISVCDQPFLALDHVRALRTAQAAHPERASASGYADTRGVPAVFGAAWFLRLEALHGERGAGSLLRGADQVNVVDWPLGAFDIDTPADIAALDASSR